MGGHKGGLQAGILVISHDAERRRTAVLSRGCSRPPVLLELLLLALAALASPAAAQGHTGEPDGFIAPGCFGHMIADGHCHGVCMGLTENQEAMDGGDCQDLVQKLVNASRTVFNDPRDAVKLVSKLVAEENAEKLSATLPSGLCGDPAMDKCSGEDGSTMGVVNDACFAIGARYARGLPACANIPSKEKVTPQCKAALGVPCEEEKLLAQTMYLLLKKHMFHDYGDNYPSWNMAVILVLFADKNNDGVLSEEEALSFFPALSLESFEALAALDQHDDASISVSDVAQSLATLHGLFGIEHSGFPTPLLPQDVTTTLFQLIDLDADAHLSPSELQALGIGSELASLLAGKAIDMAPLGGFEASNTVSFKHWARMLKDHFTDCSQVLYVDGSRKSDIDININTVWLPKGQCDILILSRTKVPAPFNISSQQPQCVNEHASHEYASPLTNLRQQTSSRTLSEASASSRSNIYVYISLLPLLSSPLTLSPTPLGRVHTCL